MLLNKENITDRERKKEEIKKERAFNKAKIQMVDKFNEIMYELGLYNKLNKTYKLDIKKEMNYGYTAFIYLATGLNFSDLDKHKDTIQQNLKCLLIMEYQNNDDKAFVKIITKAIDTSINYSSPDIKSNEIFLGMSYSLEPIIVNCNKYCMFLLAGATGAGKTRLIYMLLLSWILSRESRNIELYISDVAKREFVNFQDVRIVRSYADNIEELRDMVKYLYLKIAYRTNEIEYYRKKGVATNIEEYNKIAGIEKMSYNYLLVDEFSVIMADKSDSKLEAKTKEEILSYLKKISKLGRAVGIFAVMCTQKVTKDEIPAIIKNMSAVRVSLRANDAISSEVILGNTAAVGLGDRLAVYSLNGGSKQDYLFSPNLTTKTMNSLLKPYIDANFPKLNLEIMIKEMEELEKEKKNPSKKAVAPKGAQDNKPRVVENLPYDIILHDPKCVREEKVINFSKTEKPRKKAKEVENGWWLLK